MRNAFIEELVLAADHNPNIALVVGDLGYGVVESFARRFPERFFNAGVAEQNMMGLSAGLASEGFHVFAYSIANFPTFRCAEQIRNDVDYHGLPVTVVAVGGGLAYGSLGYSHHAIQDYALIRSFPNMLIAAPGDPMEVRACMRYLVTNPQPSYLRLGKAGEACVHAEVPVVEPGRWVTVKAGKTSNMAFLSTGAALALTSELVNYQPDLADATIASLPLWSMQTKALQVEQIRRFDRVTTVEDHLVDGGFGSWLLEATISAPDLLSRIRIKALDSKVSGMVGKQSTLNEQGGLVHSILCE
jgi:transketolase